MTPRAFSNKMRGYEDKQTMDLAAKRRFTAVIASGFGAKIKEKHIWPLSIDSGKSESISEDEMKQRQELAREELKKLQAQDGRKQ